MPLSIRRLGPGDEHVLRLLADEAPDFDLPGRAEPKPPLTPSVAASYLDSSWVLHWIAEEEERVLGDLVCHVLPLPYRGGTELLLYSIGVREADRRHGVGRALVGEMRRWAVEHPVDEIWVLSVPEAEAFYAACGFRRGDEHEQGILMLAAV